METVGDIFGFPIVTDETLPQDCMKLIAAGKVTVFRIDGEKATIIGQWPQELEPMWSVN